MCTCLIAPPGYAAATSSLAAAVQSSSRTAHPVIVIGFLGGFVSPDERHHPEVQMIQALRQQYPNYFYFGLFENRKVGKAYKTILNRLSAKESGALSADEKRRARIILFGHSWGASAVVALSRRLERAGIPVLLTVQLDSVAKPFQNDSVIPSNVLQAANFYQTRGLLHGRSRITAADSTRTTILGNFRWEHTEEPVQCREFSWHARLFTKGHIEIECDPKVWARVGMLLRHQLPDAVVPQTNVGAPDLRPSAQDEEAIRQR